MPFFSFKSILLSILLFMCIDAKSQNTIEPFFKGEASSRYDLNVQFANASKKWKKEDFRWYIGNLYDRIFAYEDKAKKILKETTIEIVSLEQDIEDLERELKITKEVYLSELSSMKNFQSFLSDSLIKSTESLDSARESIILLKDSLALMDSLINAPHTVESVNSEDYLNQYAKSGVIPTEETILTLELHRIMLMREFIKENNGINAGISFSYKTSSIDYGYGPELLSPNDVSLSEINAIFSGYTSYALWSDILKKRKGLSWTSFNSFFPQIELTKGKLLTFISGRMGNNDVTDFLVTSAESYSAGRRQYHWKLTEGHQSSISDLTLDIYEVEGEFYLAMDMYQLMRFGFWVISPSYGLVRPSGRHYDNIYHTFSNDFSNPEYSIFTGDAKITESTTYWDSDRGEHVRLSSKPSVIFSRKNPDASNTLANTMIEPMNMIFLFKLKEE